jgi:MFS family permease
MIRSLLQLHTLQALNRDGRVLFATRFVRLFAYGMLAVVLFLYLSEAAHLSDTKIGLLLSLTLLGDMAVSLPITISADRMGRRHMLVIGALLMTFAGVVFALTHNYALLLLAAIIGVVSPSGNEIGPFLSIEQAALSQTVAGPERTGTFAWYTVIGSLATALGSYCGGMTVSVLQHAGWSTQAGYQAVVFAYAAAGLVLAAMFLVVSPAAEIVPNQAAAPAGPVLFGLHRSRGIVAKLSALFALDAFGGGFIVQAIVAYWFYTKFQVSLATLGTIFLVANLLAGLSALSAASIAKRIGLIQTMVATHIPSNLLLICVPLMPDVRWATAVLFLRFSISQMDVPTRQSYTMAVVAPDERSAASGVTGVARSLGAALSPYLAGRCLAAGVFSPWFSAPFFLSGGIKTVYDLLLYRSFRAVKPPEERPALVAHQADPAGSSAASHAP